MPKKAQGKGSIRRSLDSILSHDEYAEALHPVADLDALARLKTALRLPRNAYLFPTAVVLVAGISAFILPLNALAGVAIGCVAGFICAVHLRSERDAAPARTQLQRRYTRYVEDFGNLVQIDEHGLHFFDAQHNHLVYYLPWITVRSFAFSQDALVVRTTDEADAPVVVPLQLFTDEEQLKLFQRLMALTR